LSGGEVVACPLAGQREWLASQELAAKNFQEAQKDYQLIVEQCPDDAVAWRNLGRAAAAAGDLPAAEAALAKADEVSKHARDPELHFLRGELLYELKRDAEGRAEQDKAIAEIGPAPTDRNERLWLGRIEARRGNITAADHWFALIDIDAGPAGDTEVALTRAEVLIRGKRLANAKLVLDKIQKAQPGNARALELAAWMAEIEGDLGAELAVRQRTVTLQPENARANADYGRVLERVGRRSDALAAYKRARTLEATPETVEAAERLSHQLAPEVFASLSGYAEPVASAIRMQAAGNAQIGDHTRIGMTGFAEAARRDAVDVISTSLGALASIYHELDKTMSVRGALGYRNGNLPRRAIDGYLNLTRQVFSAEGSAYALVGDGVLDVRAAYHAMWTDAAVSIIEGGDQTGAEMHMGYPLLDRRLILDAAALTRRLQISANLDGKTPGATHTAMTGGFDVILWRNFASRLRGEVLDENLDRPVYLQDAFLVGYRHLEAFVTTSNAFERRIDIAPRATQDMVTATFRKVLLEGQAGIEVRGLAGYDSARVSTILGIGLSAYVASWRGGRLVLRGELASESQAVVSGRRTWMLASYHHDLL
jgi:tetratricopeptide (TPR) repeat protein